MGGTGGGDGDECCELLLQEVQLLSWTPESKRALVMIGDTDPHEPVKTYDIDWRDEVCKLNLMIYLCITLFILFLNEINSRQDVYISNL